jgi:hypothetical protein
VGFGVGFGVGADAAEFGATAPVGLCGVAGVAVVVASWCV